jgi:hypothetical protein
MVPTAHVLQAVQVTLSAVSNEGHFTVEVETVFLPYLPKVWNGLTERWHMVPTAHVLEAVEVTLKVVSNQGHFTIEVESFSSVTPQGFKLAHWVMTYGTHCSCPTSSASYIEGGQ